jgi:hypothetical protein
MASALTLVNKHASGDPVRTLSGELRLLLVQVAFSGTYTTNGEAFDPAASDAGIVPSNAKLQFVDLPVPPTGAHTLVWDSVNKKIKVFVTSTGVELANGSAAMAGTTVTALCVLGP